MTDTQNQVVFGASVSGLTSGVQEATSSVSKGVSEMKVRLGELHETFLKAFEMTVIYETVKATFEKLTGAALEYGERLERLAFSTGANSQQTQLLSNQLAVAGIEAGAYTGMLYKMERQLRNNEGALAKAGLVTRNAAGEHLSMNQIMQNSVHLLEQYKAGYDRNAVALMVFGRSAEEVVRLRKLDNETTEIATRLQQEFGTVTAAQIDRAYTTARAMNGMGEAIRLTSYYVSAQLLPYVKKLAQQLEEYLGHNLETVVTRVKEMVTAIDGFFTFLYGGFKMAEATVFSIGEAVYKTARAVDDAWHGSYVSANIWLRSIGDDSKAHWKKTLSDVDEANKEFDARTRELWAKIKADTTGDAKGGDRKVAASDAEQKELDAKFAAEEKARMAHSQAMLEIAQSQALGEIQIAQDEVKTEEATGRISSSQAIQRQMELKQQELQLAGDTIQKRMALLQVMTDAYRAHFGSASVEFAKFNAQAITEMEKFKTELAKLGVSSNVTLTQMGNSLKVDLLKPWTDLWQGVEEMGQSTLSGLLNKTTTWVQAERNALNFLGNETAKFLVRRLKAWILNEQAQTGATLIGTAARQSAEEAASGESIIMGIVRAIKAIITGAAQTFAGVFAFLSPEMGPAAAGPAAASSGAVMGAMSMLPAFEKGAWEIPGTMAAMVHKGETILPAPFAEVFRMLFGSLSTLMGGGGGGDGGDIHIHAMDSHDVRRFVRKNSSEVVNGVRYQARQLNPAFTPARR